MTQNKLSATILLALFVAVLALPFFLRPKVVEVDSDLELRIYSPHPQDIQIEFERAFNDSRLRRDLPPVKFVWLDAGGTSNIMKSIRGLYRQENQQDVTGADIMFGGGDYPYYQLMDGVQRGGQPTGPLLEPVKLPADVLQDIPRTYSGFTLYSDEGYWYGAVISGFGMMYNDAALEHLGAEPPVVWGDLGDPKLFGWVAAADPGASGSMHMMFEIILQAYGFEKGFDVLMRMGGNSRYFSEGSNQVVRDVALGDVAVGCAIDFYAQIAIGAYGSDRLGYVYPRGQTIFNPDCIGILKDAPHLDEAVDFVRFVLSPEGQKIWLFKAGAEGGPEKYTLYRKPILESIYETTDPEKWAVKGNPYAMEASFEFDSRKSGRRWTALSILLRAAMIDNAGPLRRAWKTLIDAGLPAEGVKRFGTSEVSEEELMAIVKSDRWKNDAAYRARKRTEWTNAFREKYYDIVDTDWTAAP